MKAVFVVAAIAVLLNVSEAMEKPSFHTKGTLTGKPTGTLKPGEYSLQTNQSSENPFLIQNISLPTDFRH